MELEAELGTQLLIRGKRKVTLTEEGEFLRQRAQELVDLADKTTADLQSRDSAISGEIYIGASETRGMAFVARAMKQMQEQHPLVSFNLYSGDDEIIAERLDRGLLDFGLFVGAGATGVVDEAGVAGKADEVGAAFTPLWVSNGAVVPAGVVDVADGLEVDDIVGVAEVVGTTGVTGAADCGPPNGLVGLTGLVEPFGCTGFGCGLG